MKADRIDYYANQLRGIPMSDLGRKLREVLRDATNSSRQKRTRRSSPPQTRLKTSPVHQAAREFDGWRMML